MTSIHCTAYTAQALASSDNDLHLGGFATHLEARRPLSETKGFLKASTFLLQLSLLHCSLEHHFGALHLDPP